MLQGPIFEAVVRETLRRGRIEWLWRAVGAMFGVAITIVYMLATDDHTHLFLGQ